ncbi:MAG: TraR/DksA family transcriptional regulator [Planctomycetaceae bacterium]
MARKDALLRLHERLLEKREAIRNKLAEEHNLTLPVWSGSRDVGDAASENAETELDTQLAALESRDLAQIEQAIQNIRDGCYGLCEMCERAIPIQRLKALPFTTFCVECQREAEDRGYTPGGDTDVDWESAYEHEGRMNDRELTMRDIDVSG